MKGNHAADQARPGGRQSAASAPRQDRAGEPEKLSHAEDVVPSAPSGRRWTVRVHWGIVFAIVASLVLWFAIKMVVELAL